MRGPRHIEIFWRLCAALLIATAAIKLWTLATAPGQLAIADPSLPGLRLRDSVLIGVVLEAICAGLLLFSRGTATKALAMLWWCGIVLIYRAGYPSGVDCPCLGNLPDILGLKAGAGSAISLLLLYIFLVGSLIALWTDWRHRRRLGEQCHFPVAVLTWLVVGSQSADTSGIAAQPDRLHGAVPREDVCRHRMRAIVAWMS